MADDKTSVVITGVGLLTSVGNHATQTAASVRAGINRFAEWPLYAAENAEGEPAASVGIIAAAAEPRLGNTPWYTKIEALLTPAIREAMWNAELYDASTRPWISGVYKIAGFLARYADRVPWAAEAKKEFVDELLPGLFDVDKKVPADLVEADHAAGFIALGRAIELLQQKQADACLVCGVDSFLDVDHLKALKLQNRLKSPKQTAALIPGEAGAAIVLEREGDARKRKAKVLAHVASVALDKEPVPLGDTKPSQAAGLSRAVQTAIEGAGGPMHFRRVLVDLNGERSRFLEWALVEGRCLSPLPSGWDLWHPADCLGDIGAAFGPAALALAARALSRKEAGNGVLVCASSEKGERGAVALLAAT